MLLHPLSESLEEEDSICQHVANICSWPQLLRRTRRPSGVSPGGRSPHAPTILLSILLLPFRGHTLRQFCLFKSRRPEAIWWLGLKNSLASQPTLGSVTLFIFLLSFFFFFLFLLLFFLILIFFPKGGKIEKRSHCSSGMPLNYCKNYSLQKYAYHNIFART